ncbi:hypothetical protein [Niastella sp. OAS944]|uniref:hypothetical protein n=1 Tax=Niastella sp. OAS944 TaxID=2664089 RepID=UPI00346977C1|nr:hypothetical protein [Chitinophagaceae bacterium OAS944]
MKTTVAPSHYRYLLLFCIVHLLSPASLLAQLKRPGRGGTSTQEPITYNTQFATIANMPNLKAVFRHNNGMLTWTIDNEVNQDYYIVERSYNGINFTKAGSVGAVNDSGIHEYRFLDYSLPTNGIETIYYRIKQKDLTGNTAVSRLVALPIATHASAVSVYPNPVIGEAGISITVERSQHVVVRLADKTGMHLQTKVWEINAGSNSLPFDMSSYAPGSYILDISSGLIKKRLIIIKR